MTKTALGVLGADQRISRLRVKPHGAGELTVVDPLSQHELVLVLDVRVDELKEHPALDAIIGFARIIGRAVRQTAANQRWELLLPPGTPWPATG